MRSLRGDEAKERFIKEYSNIKVLFYSVLLNNQTKENQCGGELKDRYYEFSAINNKTRQTEIFYLGYDCGEQLMKKLNLKAPKLFNPLQETIGNKTFNKNTHSNANDEKTHFTPLGKELLDIIGLMRVGLALEKTGILDGIVYEIIEKPYDEPKAHFFASLNTILNKYNATLQGIIKSLQDKNKDKKFKKFNFSNSKHCLEIYLKEKNKNDKICF